MGSFLSILDPLRDGLYHLLLAFQGVLAPLVGSHSAWLAIVALTVTVRVPAAALGADAMARHPSHAGACSPSPRAAAPARR